MILDVISDKLNLSGGSPRSILAKKNIFDLIFIKGVSILIGLVLLPLTINYLTPEKYGIWITLSSIIGWFGFFDIGLGNGLRNHFAQALAQNDVELAKKYVSTTYAILGIIVFIVLVIFYIVNIFLDWNKILNLSKGQFLVGEISLLAIIVFSFFCLRFIFGLITIILKADQHPAKASFLDLLSQALSLVIIFILTRSTKGSMLYLGIAVSAIPVCILIVANIWFFNGKYRPYKPELKYIDFSKGKSLLTLGLNFFVIQIAGILLYETNNIVILHLSGSMDVTYYNVAYKYFSVLIMGFTIIITPFWSAFTEAWYTKDLNWIRKVMRKLFRVWILILILSMMMLFFSRPVYRIWIGKEMNIPIIISLLVTIITLINIWNGIFSQFLNGVGKIFFQLILGISGAILNVPLAIFLGSRIGIQGVLIANIIVTSFGVFLYPIQYKKLLNNTAAGIWNK
jgi:O-antigen/teichoic acid export membrane protein